MSKNAKRKARRYGKDTVKPVSYGTYWPVELLNIDTRTMQRQRMTKVTRAKHGIN